MKNIILKSYVNKLSINDIKLFCDKNNLMLDNYELNIIYNYIKKNYINIINDENKTLSDAKELLSNSSYEKIKELYLIYRNKYKNYL